MKAPPFLLGVAIIFWGWQTGAWVTAFFMAVILEGAAHISWRIDLSEKGFARVAYFSMALLFGISLYQLISGHLPGSLELLIQCTPLALFPLMVSQLYSPNNQIKADAFFQSIRGDVNKNLKIRMDAVFFSDCLLAAAAANTQTPFFYFAVCLLCVWALWGTRSPRHSLPIWIGALGLSILLGYFSHFSLAELQVRAQETMADWFDHFSNPVINPYQGKTRIGKLGTIHLSDQIVLIITPSRGQIVPPLLRTAIYNTYKDGTWFSRSAPFVSIPPQNEKNHNVYSKGGWHSEYQKNNWLLGQPLLSQRSVKSLAFLLYSRDGKVELPLPFGAYQISNLNVEHLALNPLGDVEADNQNGYLAYQVKYSMRGVLDSPPTPDDLMIPADLDTTLTTLAAELHFKGKTPQETLTTVEDFFQQRFSYTLFLGDSTTGPRTLSDFLLHSHEGHCEYFASSTVFLLRKAGIPARYVTGYLVPSAGPGIDQYRVRTRDGHAWTMAYLSGHWVEVDTTPAAPASADDPPPPFWQPVRDTWEIISYRVSQWYRATPFSIKWMSALFFLVVFAVWAGWKIKKAGRISIIKGGRPQKSSTPFAFEENSPFYRVIHRLNQGKNSCEQSETLIRWADRILSDNKEKEQFKKMIFLHYRLRFDPEGLSNQEKIHLFSWVEDWLRQK